MRSGLTEAPMRTDRARRSFLLDHRERDHFDVLSAPMGNPGATKRPTRHLLPPHRDPDSGLWLEGRRHGQQAANGDFSDEHGFLWLLVPDTAYVALPPVGAGLALFHAWVYSLALYISSAGLIGRRAIFLVPVHASLVSPQEQVPFLKVQLNLERDRVPDLQKREGLRVVPDG